MEQFATELATFLPRNATMATIPTSRMPTQADYCDRFDAMCEKLAEQRPDVEIIMPIIRIKSGSSLHAGERMRNIAEEMAKLKWVGFPAEAPSRLFLIDDVITVGTMFKACQGLLARYAPGTTAVGVFWARTVWLDSDEVDEL